MSQRITFFVPSLKRYDVGDYSNLGRSGDRTGVRFVPLSITGEACALRCDHCNGRLLRAMRAITVSREDIYRRAAQLQANGCEGVLITGGCDRNGVLPAASYAAALAQIRRELGLKIALHTKFLDRRLAEALAYAGVDRVMVDVVGSDETLRSVFHLETSRAVVEETVSLMKEYRLRAAPHIIMGIQYGKILGEERALELLDDVTLESLVLVVVTPLRGTKMQGIPPPPLDKIEEIVAGARARFPKTPLVLGCARPTGHYQTRLETLAVRHRLDGIAYPTEETIKLCQEEGIDFEFSPLCCAFCTSGE